MHLKAPDPQRCRFCRQTGRIIRSTFHGWYRRRRHECRTCLEPDGEPHRWSSWQYRFIKPTLLKRAS
jgi:hypothetical protein